MLQSRTEREVMIDSWDIEPIRSQAILHEDGIYKMWFTGRRSPIGYGESTDGKNWTFQKRVLFITENIGCYISPLRKMTE